MKRTARYLLDTDSVSDLVRNPQGAVAARIAEVGQRSVATSVVVAAELRLTLENAGTPIGPNDMFIAAQAIALDMTVVSGKVREFSRVPSLRTENWLE